MGLFGKGFDAAKWSDRLSTAASGLGAAQAYMDGDPNTASQITGMQQQRAAAARKQAEEAAQRQQMMAALQKQNLTPEQAQLVIGGAASYGDVHPKAPEPTEQQRNFEAYGHMTPEQRQAFGSYQDVVNPRFTNTPAGTQFVPRSATGGWQSQYDPKEWEPIAGPPPPQGAAAAPQAQPSFTPDAANMQRLYHQQFGPQQGQAMFQEWLHNSRHGGR